MDAREISQILSEFATLIVLTGGNQFRSRAFENGARTVKTMGSELFTRIEEGTLTEIKGIGKGLAGDITALVKDGSFEGYEELRSQVPDGLLEMLKISGLGPKRVKLLYDNLSVTTIGELEYACQENRLVDLAGFGKKSQDKIVIQIANLREYSDRHLIHHAKRVATELLRRLEAHYGIIRAEIAGGLRRCKETVHDIDIVASATAEDVAAVMEFFVGQDGITQIVAQGQTKSSIRTEDGLLVDLRVVSEDAYPAALHYFTGSKEHNTAMRGLARTMGMTLNEYSLSHLNDDGEAGDAIPCPDETAIFSALGMNYIEPELREDLGEIEAAQIDSAKKENLPDLVTEDDIRGVVHTHTTGSDGSATLEEMVEACQIRGYEYLVVSDHSRSAVYAGGLSIDEIVEQHRQIDALNNKLTDFKIFKSIESDILADGSLDYQDDVLESFDCVIASVHSGMNMDVTQATERLLTAIRHPATAILGHPTARLLLAREGFPLDFDAIIGACAEHKVSIEINASPHRLDMDWTYLRQTQEAGVPISINPDAHTVEGLDVMTYGVGIARKGWLTASDVLNTRSADEFAEWCVSRRE